MEYTVRKNKWNRFAFRFVGFVFVIVALSSIIAFIYSIKKGQKVYAALTGMLICACLAYGIYLIKETFKFQAYDIRYIFENDKIRLIGKHRERKILYKDIDDIGYVVPSPDMDYSIIQIKVKKNQYIIPYMNKSDKAQEMYKFLNEKVKANEG